MISINVYPGSVDGLATIIQKRVDGEVRTGVRMQLKEAQITFWGGTDDQADALKEVLQDMSDTALAAFE